MAPKTGKVFHLREGEAVVDMVEFDGQILVATTYGVFVYSSSGNSLIPVEFVYGVE